MKPFTVELMLLHRVLVAWLLLRHLACLQWALCSV